MDAGTSDGEFLGIDIGNRGAYRRLENWDQQHADGAWYYETFTLTEQDLSDAFTIRFFGIAKNAFTTFAIDNVMIAAAPGSVVVEPVPEGPDDDTEQEPTARPDLAATDAAASPLSIQSGDTINVSAG